MGIYVSKPETDKHSSDESARGLRCGSSCMQGWRKSQEDAHNTELTYDEEAAFFAVYDGHGGAEVAQYCAEHLPAFIRNSQEYKDGNYEKALIDGFLNFDQHLLEDKVMAILKVLADPDKETCSSTDSEEGLELAELCEEANMTIEDVLKKNYTDEVKKLLKIKDGQSSKADSTSTNEKGSTLLVNGSDSKDEVPSSTTKINGDTLSSNNVKAEEEVSDSNNGSKEGESKTTGDADVKTEEKGYSGKGKSGGKGGKVKGKSAITTVKTGVVETEEDSNKRTKATEAGGLTLNSLMNGEDEASTDDDSSVQDEAEDDIDDEDEEEELGEEDSDDTDEEDLDEEEDTEGLSPEDIAAANEFSATMQDGPGFESGCTACVGLLVGNKLWVANVGDSRCVVGKLTGKGEYTAHDMSVDHKPEDEVEETRIKNAGGRVTSDGRVNGGLNLSRALGDHAYKQNSAVTPSEQMISALPDVTVLTLTPEDEFVVIACDGIWNSMSSQQVVDYVAQRRTKEGKMSKICEEMFMHCLAPDIGGDGTGCDNMTCLIFSLGDRVNGANGSEVKVEDSADGEDKSESVLSESAAAKCDTVDETDVKATSVNGKSVKRASTGESCDAPDSKRSKTEE